MSEFQDKVVVVTGGAHGIGKATAMLFAREKAKVVVLDWKEEHGAAVQAELRQHSPQSIFLKVDISNTQQVLDAVSQIDRLWGRIDILFANAAVQVNKLAADISEEEWDFMHNVNLKGVYLCCKHVIPLMQKYRSGAIIITASGQSLVTSRCFAAYAATKAGLLAFMKGLALDYAEDGIRANCVLPGCIETALMDVYLKLFPDAEAERKRLIGSIPMRRLGTPEDIAKAVRYLASSDASYVTGSSLLVDGGLLA